MQADPDSGLGNFNDRLQDAVSALVDSTCLSDQVLEAMFEYGAAAANFDQSLTRPAMAPPNFAEDVWPSYLNAIGAVDYYFSIEELVLMANVARIALICFKQEDGMSP